VDFSIIIPAWNEEHKIAADIEAATAFLNAQHFRGEIIVVNDGSRDRTVAVAQEAGQRLAAPLRVLSYGPHRGKGHAVRTGVLASRGKWVLFADSGLTVPFEQARLGLRLLQSGACDLAYGSRKLPNSVILQPQPVLRRWLSAGFQRLIRAALPVPKHLTDTQCGFKLYRGEVARELYAASRMDGFLFDLEIILLAAQRRYAIREFPITWRCDPDSRLSLARSFRQIVRDLAGLRQQFAEP